MKAAEYARLYRTKAWHRLRAITLRDNPLCVYCEQLGRLEPATVVDHVVPHKGDEGLFFNGELASMCKSCHDGAKKRLEMSGRLVGHDAAGGPLDAAHHWNNSK